MTQQSNSRPTRRPRIGASFACTRRVAHFFRCHAIGGVWFEWRVPSLVRGAWLCALVTVACSPAAPPVDAGTPTEADSPLAQRFLRDALPWAVSADATSAGLVVTAGINAQPRIREPRYRPIAVSADVLAVVFPPGDHPGFDVAFGGFEKPWERVPLTSIRANQVASLDAVADGRGGAWVAMRLLDRKEKLVLLHWAPGQSVTTERLDFPIGINPIPLPYLEACNDVTLGVSPAGALDLIVRSDPNPLETRLFHGRRSAGSWLWDQVVNGRNARASVPQNSAWDYGCKSALAYDGLGRAVLAVLVQQTNQAVAGLAGRGVAVFTEGKDGRFWAKETAFMTISQREPSELRGLVDVISHPSGFVFGGPAVADQKVPSEATIENPDGLTPFVYLDAYHPYFPRSTSFVGKHTLASDFRFAAMSGERLIGRQTGGQPVPRRGGKILSDGCGQFALAVTDWDEPDLWSFNTLGKRCDDPRPAPVFRSTFAGKTNAAFSHGFEAPYSVGVCLDEARQTLGVCFGGHVGLEQAPVPAANLVANALVASSVDGGLELEFEAPLRDPAQAAEVYDLDVADRLFGTWALMPGTTSRYAFTPRTAFKAQNHYRVVVVTQNQNEAGPVRLAPWQTPKGRFDVIDFTTAGMGPAIDDVWSQPFALEARYARNDAGLPELLFDDRGLVLLGSEPVRLTLTGQIADDFGRTSLDAGVIRRSDGGALPDGSVPVLLDSRWVDVPAPRDAGEQETFVVELPPFFDRHGRAFEDRVVLLKTGYFPLTIRSTVPADGELVATPPADVRIRVNRPDPERHVNGTAFSLEQVASPDGGSVVGSITFGFAASPFEVRLTPTTPLRAGASYRLVSRVDPTPATVAVFTVGP